MMAVCEILDSETRQICDRKAKVFLFNGDIQLRLCPKHFEIWDKRGKLEEKKWPRKA